MTGLILFDFDGTLYRGDAPFRFYAAAIARRMALHDRTTYLKHVEAHLRHEPGVIAGDNWEAVVLLARPYIPGEHVIADCFRETRQWMNSGSCPLNVPAGLGDFLESLQGRFYLACASNSPEEAALPLLDRLGLSRYFDRIIPNAHKPEMLTVHLQRFWGGRIDPRRTAAVGDNYRNDIAPAAALGCFTAHISPRGYFPGPSSVHGRTMEEILPALRKWTTDIEQEDTYGAR